MALELIDEFIIADNKLTFLQQKFNDYQKHNNELNYLTDLITSYISGHYDESNIELFLIEYTKIILSNDELLKYNVDTMIQKWSEKFDEYEDAIKYETLNNLLNTLSNTSALTNNEICIITKKIWEFSSFRKLIKLFPKLTSGAEYASSGLFKTIFYNKNMPFYDDMGELMNIFQSIINDKTIHDDIIRYCHHIIELNLPYTIENGHHHIYEKKCSTLPYIIFIMNLLLRIIYSYELNDVLALILSTEQEYSIKDYNISELPFFHALYISTLYSIKVAHISAITTYFKLNREYNLLLKRSELILFDNDLRILNDKLKRIVKLLSNNLENTNIHIVVNLKILNFVGVEGSFFEIV